MSSAKPRVHIFLDESGTSPHDPFTLVGATAFLDTAGAERAIKDLHSRVLGEVALWNVPGKRSAFQLNGFHFTEDSETVRDRFLNRLTGLRFRAYVAYAKNDGSRTQVELLVGMYGTLLRSVLLRYRHCEITVVFEENPTLTRQFGKLWSFLKDELKAVEDARATIGTKAAPCLAVTDYVLGVTRVHLGGQARPFEETRFQSLGRNYAYLIDYDNDRHLGGRRNPIV